MAESKGKDFGNSVVRTILVPAVVTLGTKVGLDMAGADLGEIQFIVEVGAGYVAYTVLRALEVFVSPKWGYIIGISQNKPTYFKE